MAVNDFAPWLGQDKTGALTLSVHAQPGAKRTQIVGTHGERLKIAVACPPVDGKANQALIKALAKELGLAKRDITLLSGETSREKRLRIENLSKDDLLALIVAQFP